MLGISANAIAQESPQFLDTRDGNNYRTIQVHSTIWLQDNLRYETAHSYYPNSTKKKEKVANGNFYSYQEAQEVCPQGWRLPSEEDWEAYFVYLLASQDDARVAYKVDTLHEEFISLVFRDTSERVNLFSSTSPLSLRDIGWVEGRKFRPNGTMSYWITHSKQEDKRFHIHLRKRNYTMHRHKHHLEDKKRKRRQFMVRCVRNFSK